jgi:hypothetical protein
MILYHRTGAAHQILANGFRDGEGTYLTSVVHRGVWLSNMPLDCNEGAKGDQLLCLELDEQAIAEFEWIEEGKGYREWCIPAQIINERAIGLRLVDGDEETELIVAKWRGLSNSQRPLP